MNCFSTQFVDFIQAWGPQLEAWGLCRNEKKEKYEKKVSFDQGLSLGSTVQLVDRTGTGAAWFRVKRVPVRDTLG